MRWLRRLLGINAVRTDMRVIASSQVALLRKLKELRQMSDQTDVAIANLQASVNRLLAKLAEPSPDSGLQAELAAMTAERDALLAGVASVTASIDSQVPPA